jgi:hypothetical protein
MGHDGPLGNWLKFSRSPWAVWIVRVLSGAVYASVAVLGIKVSIAPRPGSGLGLIEDPLNSLGPDGNWLLFSMFVSFCLDILRTLMMDRVSRYEREHKERAKASTSLVLQDACLNNMRAILLKIRACSMDGDGLHELKATLFVRTDQDEPHLEPLVRVGGNNKDGVCGHTFPTSGENMGVAGTAYAQSQAYIVEDLPDLNVATVSPKLLKQYAQKTSVNVDLVREEREHKRRMNRSMPRSFYAMSIRESSESTNILGVIVVDCTRTRVHETIVQDRFDALIESIYETLKMWINERNQRNGKVDHR